MTYAGRSVNTHANLVIIIVQANEEGSLRRATRTGEEGVGMLSDQLRRVFGAGHLQKSQAIPPANQWTSWST